MPLTPAREIDWGALAEVAALGEIETLSAKVGEALRFRYSAKRGVSGRSS